MKVCGPIQVTGDSEEHELTHSYIVDSFMKSYGSQVENADEVFSDESHYAAIVKVTGLLCCAQCYMCSNTICEGSLCRYLIILCSLT